MVGLFSSFAPVLSIYSSGVASCMYPVRHANHFIPHIYLIMRSSQPKSLNASNRSHSTRTLITVIASHLCKYMYIVFAFAFAFTNAHTLTYTRVHYYLSMPVVIRLVSLSNSFFFWLFRMFFLYESSDRIQCAQPMATVLPQFLSCNFQSVFAAGSL